MAELAAARSSAAADADEAAHKLGCLHFEYAAVVSERDQLLIENERLRKMVCVNYHCLPPTSLSRSNDFCIISLDSYTS